MKRGTRIALIAGAVAAVGLAAAGAGIAGSYGGHGGWHGGPKMGWAGHHMGHGMHGGPHAMLAPYDADADGRFTQDELDQGNAAEFAKYDANGDGALSLDEFQALWLARVHERMVDHFQHLDADGDAGVTAAEFAEPVEGLVARMDRNDDGVLDRDDRRHRHGEFRGRDRHHERGERHRGRDDD